MTKCKKRFPHIFALALTVSDIKFQILTVSAFPPVAAETPAITNLALETCYTWLTVSNSLGRTMCTILMLMRELSGYSPTYDGRRNRMVYSMLFRLEGLSQTQ